MSVTTSTDPVQAVKDILDAATSGDFSNLGAVPDRIQKAESSSPSDALAETRKTDVSLYVWSPADGVFEAFAAGVTTYKETQTVQVGCFAPTSAKAANAAADVRAIFAADYWPDNSQKSNWREIRPATETDSRAQAFQSGLYTVSVQLVLSELRST